MLLNPIFIGIALFVLGACIGSFLNVVIWRSAYLGQPVTFGGKTAGLSLSWPPSHCPHCHSGIRWHQNIPVLAWVFLRGRCAKCHAPIPVRYPLVELATGLAFAGLYVAYFHTGWGNQRLGLVDTGMGRIMADFFSTGGGTQRFTGIFDGGISLALDMVLVAVLFAASGIDADWYEIPTLLTNVLLATAMLSSLFGWQPGLPALNPAGPAGRMAVGGTVGLLGSMALLWAGVLPRSFSSFFQALPSDAAAAGGDGPGRSMAPMAGPKKNSPSVAATALILLAVAAGWFWTSRSTAALLTLIGAMAIFLLGVLPRSSETADETQQVLEESAAPSARAEILKELLFILPPVVLAVAAVFIPFSLPHAEWLERILGVLLGMLWGGGLIWITRILGTLALNKVAMGLGDVHLMAAIGAVVGARLVLPIFFIAPVLGLLWAIVLKFFGKPNVLPYGPWLSMAAILALLVGWPIEHWYLLKIFAATAAPVPPPIHWPGTP